MVLICTLYGLLFSRMLENIAQIHIFEATFEEDAEMVTNALKDGGSNHPEFGHVINEG